VRRPGYQRGYPGAVCGNDESNPREGVHVTDNETPRTDLSEDELDAQTASRSPTGPL